MKAFMLNGKIGNNNHNIDNTNIDNDNIDKDIKNKNIKNNIKNKTIVNKKLFSVLSICLAIYLTISLSIILIIPSVGANNSNAITRKVVLNLLSTNRENLNGLILNTEITNLNSNNSKTINKVLRNNSLELNLKQGDYKIIIIVDDPNTVAYDYYSGFELEVLDDLSITVFLQPIGLIQGLVVDESGNLVSGAVISLECGNHIYNLTTNTFGSFYAQLPEGNCLIMAKQDNKVGIMKVNITKGLIEETTITLKKVVKTGNKVKYYLLLIVIAIALLLFALVLIKSGVKPMSPHTKHWKAKTLTRSKQYIKPVGRYTIEQEQPAEQQIEQEHKSIIQPIKDSKTGKETLNLENLTIAQQTIIETLNQREKAVVEYLIKNMNQKTWFSKLSRETKIPKTSLSRIVKGLESKKIIKTERIGKALRVRISQWFLER